LIQHYVIKLSKYIIMNTTHDEVYLIQHYVIKLSKYIIMNTTHDEVYLIQHYVIKFVSDLRQVSGFLRVLHFPPPIKLTAMI
jgi:sulfur transfer complex TusBCD TusB component (DsrH family)